MNSPRLAFYCNSVYGLGHVVRSLRIAVAATAMGAECSLITGCRHLSQLELPPGLRICSLSPVKLDAIGRPVPFGDCIDQSDIIERRAVEVLRFCKAWRPHCLLVDHHPLGLAGELTRVLLDRQLSDMHAFWGLPYAEGIPTRAYRNPDLKRAISRYDCLLVYGDQNFDDFLPEIVPQLLPADVRYVGVVTSHPPTDKCHGRGQRLIGLCGGGYGSRDFYELLLKASEPVRHKPIRLLGGPAANEEGLRHMARSRDVEVLGSASLDRVLEDADVVVSRAGYNTAFHLIQTELPLIFIPQALPNDDQPRRAIKLSKLPNVWVLSEKSHNLVEQLSAAIEVALVADHKRPQIQLDLDGARGAAARLLRRVEGK
jgi:predicted glycosyltransferase